MEAASSRPAGYLDDTLPKDAQFVLSWNPPQLYSAEENEDVILQTQEPPDPDISATPIIGYSRKAAFYDKHLATHLVLERVVYLDTLVSTLANTVDKAIQDAVAKRPLSKDTDRLMSEMLIKRRVNLRRDMHSETGITEAYLKHAAEYCRPIASTLALHPSSEHWDSILVWTSDGEMGRWAIADGILYIPWRGFGDGQWKQQLLQNEDNEKKEIIKQLARRSTPLAVWEMKSLTVGTAQVMKEISEMGLTRDKFPWKKCTGVCNHRFLKTMKESKKDYDRGSDPRSPPWTLPIGRSTPSVDSRPTARRQSLRSASIKSGTTTRLSYEESSLSSVGDGEGVGKKRPRNDEDASESEQLPKRSKLDPMDQSYEPSPKEVTAQSFLQQTWAEAVRNNCTIMVLHSGNHEIIGIRHRETQTLYISHVIEPHSCSNPAYGKIQVGIYIAAIQDTIDRVTQDNEKKARDPAHIPLKNEAANPNADLGGHPPKGPTRSNKQGKGSGSKGKRKGRQGNAKRHASGMVVDDQALLANASRQNHLCLHFYYDIYDSPHPAAFRRATDEPKEALGPEGPPTPPLSPGRETTAPPAPTIHITVHSELQPGSTGIVHIGTMAVDPSGPTAKVAVKLAFSRDEKSRLMEEHRVYSHLHSKGVQGIPRDIGLFVDEEPLLGAEGPYALVMTYAGVSLFRRHNLASDLIKDSLLATLESIHRANILHGDIRLPNLCTTPSGEAFVVDFSHAIASRSRKEKAEEIRRLSHILEMESLAKPVAEDLEKPVLRRSARIKELQRKAEVEPKIERVKRGKSTRRK